MAAADGGNRRAGDGGGGLRNSGPGGAHRPMRAVTRAGRARRARDSREGWATNLRDSTVVERQVVVMAGTVMAA